MNSNDTKVEILCILTNFELLLMYSTNIE